jgi:predicted transcriptional regulator
MAAATAKEQIRKMLDELPDQASLEDIQYHIYVRQKIERGLEDVAEGRVVDEDEAERRMARWLEG